MIRIGYVAVNHRTKERVEFYACSAETSMKTGELDAWNWIVNHLDTSDQWTYYTTGKFKHYEKQEGNI